MLLKKKRSGLRRLLSCFLAGAMIFGTAMSTGTVTAKAASDTDEILLGVFWTSDKDVTDTVYFSTDGVTFHEICEAFTDATPNDSSKGLVTKKRRQYVYADKEQIPDEGGKNGFEARPQVLKWDESTGGYKIHATLEPTDWTLHDPSILYDEKHECFWMISGDEENVDGERTVRIMMSYSKDLINWSFPSKGGSTIRLSEQPTSQKGKDLSKWDMVAPDFIMGNDGNIYIAFSIGYFAMHHPEDGNLLNDEMYPYIAKLTNIEMPTYRDTRDVNKTYVADPALIPEAEPTFTFSKAIPVKLPCMTERASVSHNHIDASFYIENGWYYYAIKENGVTNEIWRIKNLDNASDPSAWESVCYDAVTGYEGPCLTKYNGQYLLYMDRLSSFKPTDLAGNQASESFGSEGTWVAKASTDDGLNGYTGWLEENIKEIQTLKKDKSKKANRHGTVISVTGEAAKKVRAAAKQAGYSDEQLYGSLSSDWADTGWYQKESYLGNIGPNTEALPLAHRFAKYFYEGDRRVGTSRDTNRGVEKYLNLFNKLGNGDGSWVFFKADGSNPDLDGKLLTGYAGDDRNNGDSWKNQDAEVAVPTDWSTYNKIGVTKYDQIDNSKGDMTQLYKWVRYNYKGEMIKCGDSNNDRIYQDQTNKQWYRYDPTYGYMVKGAFSFKNDEGYDCVLWFDLVNGTLQKNTSFTVNGATYYTNDGGFAYYDEGRTRPVEPGVLPSVSYPDKVDADDSEPTPVPDGEPAPQHIDGKDLVWVLGGDGKSYWYENSEKQGTVDDPKGVWGDGTNRGREICDPNTLDQYGNGTWFWLDSVYSGAKAVGKEVWIPYIYQDEDNWDDNRKREIANESDPGMGDLVYEYMKNKNGKWVRYDNDGRMLKGWVTIEGDLANAYPGQAGNVYYYDSRTGLMAKGVVTIDGVEHEFDTVTGVMIR